MIADLEKAAGGLEKSQRSNRESQSAVNEIMAKVKEDMSFEDDRESLVDAVAQKVLKDLEEKTGSYGTENMSSTVSQSAKLMAIPH